MNLPNKLTTLRMILIIPFIALLLIPLLTTEQDALALSYRDIKPTALGPFLAAGSLFVLAMLTDFWDGYLARKHQIVTTFGKLFDPLADKFFTTTALIFLSVYHLVPVWITVPMILRDLVVDGARSLAAKNEIVIAASIWGKLKTVFQSCAIILIFFIAPLLDAAKSFHLVKLHYDWQLLCLNIPLMGALLLSLLSGFLYFRTISHLIKQ